MGREFLSVRWNRSPGWTSCAPGAGWIINAFYAQARAGYASRSA
jgi:hypothetical protein